MRGLDLDGCHVVRLYNLYEVDNYSFMNREYRSGERTDPWGVPVFMMLVLDAIPFILTTGGRCRRKSRIQ